MEDVPTEHERDEAIRRLHQKLSSAEIGVNEFAARAEGIRTTKSRAGIARMLFIPPDPAETPPPGSGTWRIYPGEQAGGSGQNTATWRPPQSSEAEWPLTPRNRDPDGR